MNILVTGSSRGIGKAIAKKFDEKGNKIFINSRNPVNLEKAKSDFKYCDYIAAIAADISCYEETEKIFAIIKKEVDGIDLLVNNAGIMHYGLFQDTNYQLRNNIIGVNINGTLNCTQLAVPYMLKKKNGVIINISSIWGESGASCEAVYSLTKGGINTFTKALAKELAPSGIRVNAIACGIIDTEMNDFLSPKERTELESSVPLGRFGTPSEVAELAYFLASEKSSYITGQIITIDGGFL